MTQEMTIAAPAASTTALAVRLGEMREQMALIHTFVADLMIDGTDYGSIPGTGDRKVLLKPGAEKLCELYGYAALIHDRTSELDRDSGYYRVEFTIRVIRRGDGTVIADGVGECNSFEGRYRWRQAERECPACGTAAIIRGKAELGGGWVCWKRKDGCGQRFAADEPRIVDQPVGRVTNDDLPSAWNTVLKIAKKRALVDAVISATRSSGLFTQDLEDEAAGDAPAEGRPQQRRQGDRRPTKTRMAPDRTGRDWGAFWTAIAGSFRGDVVPRTSLRQEIVYAVIGTQNPQEVPAEHLAFVPAILADVFATTDWRGVNDLEPVGTEVDAARLRFVAAVEGIEAVTA